MCMCRWLGFGFEVIFIAEPLLLPRTDALLRRWCLPPSKEGVRWDCGEDLRVEEEPPTEPIPNDETSPLHRHRGVVTYT